MIRLLPILALLTVGAVTFGTPAQPAMAPGGLMIPLPAAQEQPTPLTTHIDTPPTALPTVGAPVPTLVPSPTPPVDPECDPNIPPPAPGQPSSGFGGFSAQLPPAPRWNPPGVKRVGLQAGHWLTHDTPPELSRLQAGASGGGKQEWEVNLEIAEQAAEMLRAEGIEVDVLPTTVPQRYRAHLFISIHADGDLSGSLRGFKIARPGFSSVPAIDDRLIAALYDEYEAVTRFPRDDDHITRRMQFYYAFNSRRYCHAVAPGVPQAIVETGFLTSAVDRQMLIGNPTLAARGIANGVLRFFEENP